MSLRCKGGRGSGRGSGAFLCLVALSASAALGGSWAWAGDLAKDVARIKKMEVQRVGEGAEVALSTTRRLQWEATTDPEGNLVVVLLDSMPVRELSEVTLAEGLVASVRISVEEGEGSNTTRLRLKTRARAGYFVSAEEKRLKLEVRPRSPGAGPAPKQVSKVETGSSRLPRRRGRAVSPESPAGGGRSPAPGTAAKPIAGRALPARDESLRKGLAAALGKAEVSSAPAPAAGLLAGDRIGPHDVLSIEVFGVPELNRKVRVMGDGTITLPPLGTVPIAGLAPLEAEKKLAVMLSERGFARHPLVAIYVEEYASRTVYVQGAVHSPGVYPMLGRQSLLEVLGQAGGLSGRARQISVIRLRGGGEESRIEVDAESLIEKGDLTHNLILQPGDIVMVPHEKTLRVYVSGAVSSPGQVDFTSSEGITVYQAVTAAGGTTEQATQSKVHVIRELPDGTRARIRVNLKRIRRGKEDDLRLQPNDIVVVGEWLF